MVSPLVSERTQLPRSARSRGESYRRERGRRRCLCLSAMPLSRSPDGEDTEQMALVANFGQTRRASTTNWSTRAKGNGSATKTVKVNGSAMWS